MPRRIWYSHTISRTAGLPGLFPGSAALLDDEASVLTLAQVAQLSGDAGLRIARFVGQFVQAHPDVVKRGQQHHVAHDFALRPGRSWFPTFFTAPFSPHTSSGASSLVISSPNRLTVFKKSSNSRVAPTVTATRYQAARRPDRVPRRCRARRCGRGPRNRRRRHCRHCGSPGSFPHFSTG